MATTIEMPMNTAHQHAANAEDHSSNGLLIPSAEEHLKAAEAYMAAIARTNDDSTRRTLQMLHNEHKRSHLELQRKISRLKEEGKDPNEPQKPEVQRAPSSNSVSTFTQPMSSPSPARPLMESTTVEESFMVLGGQRFSKSDPGDAFNQFWTIMQGMLENLSQPVAFATAPLGTSSEPSRPEEHHSSDTDYTDAEERLSSRLSRKLKLGGKSVKSQLTAGGRGSPAIETSTQEGDFDDDFSDEGDDLSESFLVIPSEATMRALKQENIALKGQVGLLQHRLEATERVLRLRKEQDHYLRDSILQASKEVAQRAMGASLLGQRGPVDLGPVNLQSPSLPQPGINTPREAQYARRVKELEEELRNMRIENDRNKVMIAKFRERWDKLKESAKRKKVSKAAAVASKTGIQERILEEPEVEEEQI